MLPSDALVKLPINDRQTFSSRYALDYCYDGVRDSRTHRNFKIQNSIVSMFGLKY